MIILFVISSAKIGTFSSFTVNYLPQIAVEDLHVSPFTATIKRLSAARVFSHRPGYIALLVTLKAGVIYTQCALVHTRVRVLYRVRILYPVRNA